MNPSTILEQKDLAGEEIASPAQLSSRRHYQKNKPRVAMWQRVRYAKRATFLMDYKAMRGCELCPERDPIVLDFDHVRGEKLYDVGNAKRLSMPKLLTEIAKCRILCSNCHRKETYRKAHA